MTSSGGNADEQTVSNMEEQTFDSSTLHEYLKQNLDDFPKGDEELKIFKFSAGTSNPTFLLRKNGKEFVLRHKSPVELYIGYHRVDVEYKIMSALGGTSFPVPKVYLFCEDKTIMGQEFYVMEYVKVSSQKDQMCSSRAIYYYACSNVLESTLTKTFVH